MNRILNCFTSGALLCLISSCCFHSTCDTDQNCATGETCVSHACETAVAPPTGCGGVSFSQLQLVAGQPGKPAGTELDGVGGAATFNGPWGLATDGTGNLYVSDSAAGSVRKIVLATGTVTTYGTGAGVIAEGLCQEQLGSFAGDILVADSAGGGVGAINNGSFTFFVGGFHQPTALAAGGDAGTYVTVTGDNLIESIPTAGGTVALVAGDYFDAGADDGVGGLATFNAPEGLANDGAGTLYVADTGNHTIRKVDLATATVTTFAGAAGVAGSTDGPLTDARFNSPHGLALDGAGNLYVADTGNGTVRRITLCTGQVQTVAGAAGSDAGVAVGPVPGALGQPLGLAWVPGQGLYIADATNAVLLVK